MLASDLYFKKVSKKHSKSFGLDASVALFFI